MSVILLLLEKETKHVCEWILQIFDFSKMPIRSTFYSHIRTRTARKTPIFCKLHFAKSIKVRIFEKKSA